MAWALSIAIAWLLLCVPAGLLLGRRLRRADDRDGRRAPVVVPAEDAVPTSAEPRPDIPRQRRPADTGSQ
jgi:hypothetical protein